MGEANDLTSRPNPANGNTGTHRYHQVLLAGKRSLCPSSVSVLDCSRVYVIPQARVLGVRLSEVAPLYFLVLLAIAVLGMVYASWELLVVYMALSIAGLSVIPYLVYLELVVAEALCLYCTIMHVAIVGCTAHSITLWARLHRVVG